MIKPLVEAPPATPGRRRALIIAAEYPPVGGGGVIRIAKLVKYLPEFGWGLTVVCSDEPSPPMTDSDLVSDVAEKATVIKLRGPFRAVGAAAGPIKRAAGRGGAGRAVVRALKSVVNTLALPDRWIGWAWQVSRLPLETLGEPDLVISTGPPHSSHLAAMRLAGRLGVPFVMDLRDDWAGNPQSRSRAPWREPAHRALQLRCLSRAAAVVFVSDVSRDAHARRYPALAPRFIVIENGFDPGDFVGEAPARHAAPDEIEFLHAGSLHGRKDGAPAFRAFGAFAREWMGPRPVLVLLGSTSPDQVALARATIPPVNLRVEAPVPHAEAVRRMRAADVLAIILNAEESGDWTVTGKVFEYLAARRPILAFSRPCLATRLVAEARAGASIGPDDGKSATSQFEDVIAMARDASFAGAPDDLLARFDRQHQAAAWDRTLRVLV